MLTVITRQISKGFIFLLFHDLIIVTSSSVQSEMPFNLVAQFLNVASVVIYISLSNQTLEQDICNLEVLVPKSDRAISARCAVLNTQKFHDEAVDLDIREAFHNVRIVRGRMPTFIGLRKKTGRQALRATLVEGLDHRRERAMCNKHGVH